jgi:hypothetical protein
MFTFTDTKNRTWNLELDMLKVRRVDASDFSDLSDIKFSLATFNKETIGLLLSNTTLMFAVIWVIVQDQVEEKYQWTITRSLPDDKEPPPGSFPISPKENLDQAEQEFVRAIKGETIETARLAFVESLSDFFRDHQTALSILGRKLKDLKGKMVEKAPEVEKLLDRLTDQEFNKMLAMLNKTLDDQPGTESTS